MMKKLRRKKVSALEIQNLFNHANYWGHVKSGEFSEKLYSQGPPSPRSGEPPCTLSQMISYLDPHGLEIARVHQYLRKNGTLGGSGRPDPKQLLHNGVLHDDP